MDHATSFKIQVTNVVTGKSWDQANLIAFQFDNMDVVEILLLSEPVLARDWNTPEEDAAWEYLKAEK